MKHAKKRARPAKPPWKHVSVYLQPELLQEVRSAAKAARRSLSAQIVVALEAAFGHRAAALDRPRG